MIDSKKPIDIASEQPVPFNGLNDAALKVFESVLSSFFIQLEAIDPDITQKLRQSVRNQVSLNLSSLEDRQRLNSWIMGYTEKLQVKISVSEMQRCVHHAYLSACDYFGPSKADAILANAVRQSETMPAAKDFDPRILL